MTSLWKAIDSSIAPAKEFVNKLTARLAIVKAANLFIAKPKDLPIASAAEEALCVAAVNWFICLVADPAALIDTGMLTP